MKVEATMRLSAPIPIFRMFDEAATRAFYIDYLGCTIGFEHRFEPDMPLYMEVRRDGMVLHLSEHHGDVTPGGGIRVEVDDIDALHAELAAKPYKYLRPGIEPKPWGTREIDIKDPSGNRITFCARA